MGTTYYYQKNLQGDVIRIVNSSGTQVVAYTYDAWGNIISTTGTLASTIGEINPIRYRSYYFDTESGLYYLNSRYYDSQVKRFVNGDTVIAETGELLGNNMFAYCFNNPINLDDHDGTWPKWVKNAAKVAVGVVATAAAVALTVSTGGAAAPILIGVASSTALGGAIGYLTGGKKGMVNGVVDGFMWGGIGAFASSGVSVIKAVRTAKKGVTIGKDMDKVKNAATLNNTSTYKPMKGYNIISKVSPKLADKMSLAHNTNWINRMVKLGAPIYDNGLSGAASAGKYYGMELVKVRGYFNYVKMW